MVGLGCLPRQPIRRTTVEEEGTCCDRGRGEGAARLAGLSLEATVALADLAGAVKDGLLGFCADVGLMVMRQVMEDELTRRIGAKNARLPGREANWHGTTKGPVVLGGRIVSVERPRAR